MYYCTAAVFRDKPYMYMDGACTPFMYMYTQFMYRRESCFQGAPTISVALPVYTLNFAALAYTLHPPTWLFSWTMWRRLLCLRTSHIT